MNEPSPLVPQGSFEAQARRKSHVRIAVFSILAVHVVVLGGLLILGCKREEKTETESAVIPPPMTNDLTPPPFGGDVVTTNEPPAVPPATGTAPVPPAIPPVAPPPAIPPVVPPPETGAMTEHKVVKGETFSSIASHYGVTLKALIDANPNVSPTALQINQVVKIPPKPAPAPAVGNTAVPTDTSNTYVVKTGDVLGTIAKNNKTTVQEIQRLNHLTTTQIRVGQKLKLPPKTPPPAPAGGVPPAQ